ncbi:MAG: RluA family pseudouridine synthase [Lentisphaeria bacterium]|nr:RluA family pseudouridine synthase [Lentisphaeria bacterium]
MDKNERIIRSVIPPEYAGTRLDRYLAGRFTYFSRNQWEQLIKDGNIRLNGNQYRPSKILHGGETLEFTPPETAAEPEVNTNFQILLETEDFLAVNKPPNLPVHPSGCYFNNTLSMLLRPQYGIVHPVNRLDRETSGITLFARTPKAAGKLADQFLMHSPEKIYTALVYGVFPEMLEAKGYLSQEINCVVRKKRRFTKNDPGDVEKETAETFFRLLGTNGEISAVECKLKTGRLHQIRATLCSSGFPMVGDKMYGQDPEIFLRYIDDTMTDADRALLLLDHQALHAASLRFTSPFTGEEIFLEAPMPDDMQKIYNKIKYEVTI